MKTRKTLLAAALSAGLLFGTSAHAELTLTLGGQGVYDTDLGITWLQNANLAASNTFGVSGIDASGGMTLMTAQSWIGAMNANNYLGFNDWRLPTITDIGAPGFISSMGGTEYGYNVNTASGEMAHLWYDELGNVPLYDTNGNPQFNYDTNSKPLWGLYNTAPFSSIQNSRYYWYDNTNPNTTFTSGFNMSSGEQYFANKFSSYYAWAARDGNSAPVSAVPEPETYAMMLAGLGLLGVMTRRRKQKAVA